MIEQQIHYLERLTIRCFAATIILLVSCGCATSGMRSGTAQARWEVRQGLVAPEQVQERLTRADTVLAGWQDAYGKADRIIDDTSFYPVLEEMKSEKTFVSGLKGTIEGVTGGWYSILFGAGGAGTLLVSLIMKLMQERHRRKEMENAAVDCAAAIETISDETTRQQVKESVRKSQTSRTDFHKLVQETSSNLAGS